MGECVCGGGGGGGRGLEGGGFRGGWGVWMGVYGWGSGCSLRKHALTDYHAMDVNDQRSISDRPHNDQWVGGWVGVVVWGGGDVWVGVL